MDCIVKINETLSDDVFYLGLEPVGKAAGIVPGQFVMLKCAQSFDPFLRRPMSIADYSRDGSYFGLIIKIAGKGTRLLSTLISWDRINVLGPFGKGFGADMAKGKVWIVSGGTGVAPFLGLVENTPAEQAQFTVFIGAKTKDQLLFAARFEENQRRVLLATEDGSSGEKGFVTDLLSQELATNGRPDVILTCGPTPMMRAVAKFAEGSEIACKASLENRMACGFGACLGCVVKARGADDYFTVCRAGPVFDTREIEL